MSMEVRYDVFQVLAPKEINSRRNSCRKGNGTPENNAKPKRILNSKRQKSRKVVVKQ